MDGKLLLVTNSASLKPAEVIERYKSLADIERGFRVLKSELELGPVYRRLDDRIRAHACLCFIALVLHRAMRQRLRATNSGLSPGTAARSDWTPLSALGPSRPTTVCAAELASNSLNATLVWLLRPSEGRSTIRKPRRGISSTSA